MSSYTWNGGGKYKKKAWTEELPTDAAVSHFCHQRSLSHTISYHIYLLSLVVAMTCKESHQLNGLAVHHV